MACDAEELKELRTKEKEMNVQPDWEIDAFTKAQIRTGKRQSIVTDLILKLLGLDVSLHTPSHYKKLIPHCTVHASFNAHLCTTLATVTAAGKWWYFLESCIFICHERKKDSHLLHTCQ